MIGRRRFLLTSLAGAVAAPLATDAQQAGKVYRIGYLSDGSAIDSDSKLGVEAFRQGLRELGWVEGRNIVIDFRFAEGSHGRLTNLAAELVTLNVDVIVTWETSAALGAKHVTRTIPIVMASSGDPVRYGLVAELARPGENVTGLHITAPSDLAGKRLHLLKEAIPSLTRVGVLSDSGDVYALQMMREIERGAHSMGVRLHGVKIRRREEFDQALEGVLLARVDAVMTVEGDVGCPPLLNQ
jgi:putative ABC transport system substrate-binding protein